MPSKSLPGDCILHPAYRQRLLSFLQVYDRLDRGQQEAILFMGEFWLASAERRRWQTEALNEGQAARVLGTKA